MTYVHSLFLSMLYSCLDALGHFFLLHNPFIPLLDPLVNWLHQQVLNSADKKVRTKAIKALKALLLVSKGKVGDLNQDQVSLITTMVSKKSKEGWLQAPQVTLDPQET